MQDDAVSDGIANMDYGSLLACNEIIRGCAVSLNPEIQMAIFLRRGLKLRFSNFFSTDAAQARN
jgi:hypothetical protein